MPIEIHPKAKANFDAQADALLLELTPLVRVDTTQGQTVFNPDVVPKAIFSKDDIRDMQEKIVDPAGRILARYFEGNGKSMGLGREAYRKFVRLSEAVHRTKGIRDLVSHETIEAIIFDWIAARYRGETKAIMCEFLIERCDVLFHEFTIWIPIAALHIQSDITIGKVTLRTFTHELFDQLEGYKGGRPDDSEYANQIQGWIDGLKQKYQGRAAVTITKYGELARVADIAMEEGERALSMLRFFSGAATIPGVVSYCRLEGRENAESYTYFSASGGQAGISNGGVDPSFIYWTLPDDRIELMKQTGLTVLSDLLNLEQPTQFQEALRDSVFAYSRHTLAKDMSDKLLFIFTALDSFLLKGENEPIQQNISERIACIVGKDGADRRRIIKSIKEMYALRSKFIHHNQQIDDLDSLGEFLYIIWNFYINVMHNHMCFKTKDEFISYLEEKRLSY